MSEVNKALRFTEHLIHVSSSLSLKFIFASTLPVKIPLPYKSKLSGI